MKVGSLCTGIAGLELGLQMAGIDTKPVFVSDIDAGANQWLAANMPNVPNLGDFTALDELPEVDLITAGFPCQPFSTAGKREGLADERYLFDDIARLTSRMGTRPHLFLENVPGLLTANNGDAMARVVHSLAAIGYGITWGLLPATAVGAPHRRNRWWGLAWHSENVEQKWSVLNSSNQRRAPVSPGGSDSDAADADGVAAGRNSRAAFGSEKQARRESHGSDRFADGVRAITADTDGTRLQRRQVHGKRPDELATRRGSLEARFGPYAAAVAGWELVLERPAPDPTDDGRLNPAFVEWMMGYPEGWVTDVLPRRTQSLHALGNAVVPQCAAEAFTQLTNR